MIYFIRHGESQANVDDVFSGPDAQLTDNGRQQANNAGEEIKNNEIIIDRIISSTYDRSIDTAKIIAEIIGFDTDKIQYDHRLVEYNCGVLTDKPRSSATSQELTSAEGAEDPYLFQNRVMKSFIEIKNLSGNTLIISHAGVGSMINATKLGIEPSRFNEIPNYPNCELIILE